MNNPPMSEAERRKRLAAVYNLLLDLAAKNAPARKLRKLMAKRPKSPLK